jgi:hypothetical protein
MEPLLVALVLAGLAIGVQVLRRKHLTPPANESRSSEAEAPEAPIAAADEIASDARLVATARAAAASLVASDENAAARLASEDAQTLRVRDNREYVEVLMGPSTKAWVAILMPVSDGTGVSILLPGLRGQPNLFRSQFDSAGRARGAGAMLNSAMITGGATAAPPRSAPPERLSFGWKSSWLAVRTSDPTRVMDALGLVDAREVRWNEGVQSGLDGSDELFVASIEHRDSRWTLVWDPCFVMDAPDLIAGWSAALGAEVQCFINDRRSGTYGWGRALGGTRVRWFFQQPGAVETNEGERDPAETECVAQLGESQGVSEELVFALAARWSIDPSCIDELPGVPNRGWLASSPDEDGR